jgi:predicted RecB family nuclease
VKLEAGRLRLAASDVANFLACGHLTRLDMLRARGELRPPHEYDVGFQDLVARGEAHERAVLDGFRARGWSVAEIAAQLEGDAARATLAAIGAGADVVYQGVLLADQWDGPALFGRPDFLVRAGLLPAPDGEPLPAGQHYEVVDAKLARSAKARAVAQVGFYSGLLADAQGVRPRWMHLALGDGEFTALKVSDYAAYERQARRRLAASASKTTKRKIAVPVEKRLRENRETDLPEPSGCSSSRSPPQPGRAVQRRPGFEDQYSVPA